MSEKQYMENDMLVTEFINSEGNLTIIKQSIVNDAPVQVPADVSIESRLEIVESVVDNAILEGKL